MDTPVTDLFSVQQQYNGIGGDRQLYAVAKAKVLSGITFVKIFGTLISVIVRSLIGTTWYSYFLFAAT